MSAAQSRAYSHERFKLIFDNSPIAILEKDLSVLVDLRHELQIRGVTDIRKYLTKYTDLVKKTSQRIRILDLNQAALDLFGARNKKELITHFGKTFTPEILHVLIDEFSSFLEGKLNFQAEFKGRTLRGNVYDALLRVTIPQEYAKTFSRAITMIQDIGEQKRLERHLRRLAQLDSLTRLFNHSTITQRLDGEYQRSKRYGSSLSCMMIDVDHFKVINDEFGHQKGDQIIKAVSNTIKNSFRQVDIVGRYGGDEFFIILPETRAQNAKIAALRIQNVFANKDFFIRGHKSVKIALSIGISGYPAKDIKDAKDMITKADKAMYTAKKSGRNGIVVMA